jgi:hypothetical protein
MNVEQLYKVLNDTLFLNKPVAGKKCALRPFICLTHENNIAIIP